jgi:hypothetical protein
MNFRISKNKFVNRKLEKRGYVVRAASACGNKGTIDTSYTHIYIYIHDSSLFWLGTGTWINSGGVGHTIQLWTPLSYMVKWCIRYWSILGTDHLTWRFFFVFFVFYFFCRAKHEIFSQNSTLGYMTKTMNQIIFFSSTKIRIFFSATLGIRIFFITKCFTSRPDRDSSPQHQWWYALIS